MAKAKKKAKRASDTVGIYFKLKESERDRVIEKMKVAPGRGKPDYAGYFLRLAGIRK